MNNNDNGYFNPELKKAVESAKKYKSNVKKFERVSIVVFSVVLAATSAVLVFFERPSESETEKRKLTERPAFSLEAFFSGEYTDSFSLYFSDTVPFREKLVELNSYVKKLRGISAPTFYGNVVVVANEDGEAIESQPDVVTTIIPAQTQAPAVSDEAASVESTLGITSEISTQTTNEEDINITEFSNNGIVVDGVKMYGENAGIMLFGGNKKQGKRYADIINQYRAALDESVNIYNIVVPTSAEFYLPKKFQKYSSSEKDAIDYIYSNLAEGVTGIDAYSVLEQHTDEYIYLRTDHHWAPLGAYYAYTAFAQALGMEYHPIEDYEERVKQGFVGSLYGYTNDITLKNAPEEFHYFMPPEVEYKTAYYYYDTLKFEANSVLFHEYVEGSNCYGMFLGSDAIHTKITTNVGNGRKIVVFKESYGNAFVPFLVNNFDEIYVIDIRFFGKNAVDYIKQVGATDVLFIDNAFAANTSTLISGIERLFYSDMGTITTTVPTETEPAEETKKKQNGTTVAKEDGEKHSSETAVPETAVTETAVPETAVREREP